MDEHRFTELELDLIAQRAADKALQKIYAEVGKGVLKKLAWWAGVLIVAGAAWLAGKDFLR